MDPSIPNGRGVEQKTHMVIILTSNSFIDASAASNVDELDKV